MNATAFPDADRLDTRALLEPVSRRDADAYRRRVHGRTDRGGLRFVVLPLIGCAAVAVFLLAMSVGIQQEIEQAEPDMVSEVIAMLGITAVMLLAAVLLAAFAVRSAAQRRSFRVHARLDRFTRANGLQYLPGPYSGGHLGAIADRGAFTLRSVLRTTRGRPVEVADFALTTGDAGSRETRFGGMVVIRLAVPLPHLLLRSTRQGGHPATDGAPPAGAQRLSLEGDFDRSFTLFCPAGAETDALYLLTPDVMARLMDDVAGWDLEVVDDRLLLSRARDAVTLDPAEWRAVAGVVEAVTAKVDRWGRWRAGAGAAPPREAGQPVLAPATTSPRVPRARRLATTAPRGTLIGMGIAAAFLVVVVVARVLV